MALIGAILVEIKIIEILCERSLREGDRHALKHGTPRGTNKNPNRVPDLLTKVLPKAASGLAR